MSWLSSAVRKIAAPVATIAPFIQGGTGVGLAAGIIAQDTARKQQKQQQAIAQKQFNERFNNMDIFGRTPYGGLSTVQRPGVGLANDGFGSSFGNFLSNFKKSFKKKMIHMTIFKSKEKLCKMVTT